MAGSLTCPRILKRATDDTKVAARVIVRKYEHNNYKTTRAKIADRGPCHAELVNPEP